MNNPIKYTDPTGNTTEDSFCDGSENEPAECHGSGFGGASGGGAGGDIDETPPDYGPGYEGPIPPVIQQELIAQGADEDLLGGVTLYIMTGSATEQRMCPGNAAVTWYNDVYFCRPGYFDPISPTPTLVHELVHVRQFRDGGWLFAVKVQIWIARTDLTGEDIYEVFWAEREGKGCADAFADDSGMNLGEPQSLCRLR